MRNLIKFIIAFVVGASLFYFVVKETGADAIWAAISLFWGKEGLLILAITLIVAIFGAMRWKSILKTQGENVSFFLTIRYLVKGFTVDFLTPFSLFGGEMVRIFLMQEKVGIRKSAFSAITDKILDVTTHFFFLVPGIILFVFYGGSVKSLFFLYAGIVIIVMLLLIVLFYNRILKKRSFLFWVLGAFKKTRNLITNTENGKIITQVEKDMIDFFSSEEGYFTKGILISFLRHLFLLFRVFVIIFFVAEVADIGVALAIYGLVILSMILPLPAALGGLEAILALGFGALGLGFSSGVTAAIILRSADLIVCLFGVILFIRLSFSAFYRQFSLFLTNFGK